MKPSKHLEYVVELRQRLLKVVIVIALLVLLLLPFMDKIFTLFAQPLLSQLPPNQHMIATSLPATVFVPLKLTFYAAIFLAMPFLLYQFWAYVAPGLYRHEKRLAWLLLSLSVVLFYIGIIFSYTVVFPLIFNFFISFAPSGVLVMPDISAYLGFAMKLFIAFGLAFEVPIAMIILIFANAVDVEQCRHARPYVIVGAFIFGMLLTPPDVISQVLLAVPTWLLYELGLVLAQVIKPQKVTILDKK